MKTVKELIPSKNVITSQNSQTSEYPPEHKLRIKNLFAKLGSLFGNQKWQSFIGNEKQYKLIYASWVDGLYEFEDHQIARGLQNLEEKGAEWIPSLPEFKKLCLTQSNLPQQERTIAADKLRQQHEALPKPEVDPAIAEANINAWHDILDNVSENDHDDYKVLAPCDQVAFVGAEEEDRKHKIRLQMMKEGRFEELKKRIY